MQYELYFLIDFLFVQEIFLCSHSGFWNLFSRQKRPVLLFRGTSGCKWVHACSCGRFSVVEHGFMKEECKGVHQFFHQFLDNLLLITGLTIIIKFVNLQRLAIICIFKMVNFSVSLSSFGSWLMANERNLSAFNLKFTPPIYIWISVCYK